MKPTRPTLIIVGHGSSTSQSAEDAIEEHAHTLRLSPRFGQVFTYFLAGEKPLPDLPSGEIFILPFFMSDGYFVKTKVPALFGLKNFTKKTKDTALYQCDALGVDPQLSEYLLQMATQSASTHSLPPETTSVILIAHGSKNNPASADAAMLQRDRLEKIAKFLSVTIAFLEQEPSIGAALKVASMSADAVICVGLFAADGPHATLDVPEEITTWQQGASAAHKSVPPVYYEGVVGTQAEIVKLIQESVSRCAAKYAPSA